MTGDDRITQFKDEIAELKLKTSGGPGEQAAGVAGALLMAIGVVIALVSFGQAGGKEDLRDLSELIILNLGMVALVIVGAVLFLRTALLRFWRFWMLRQVFEHQRHLDQVVDAIRATRPEGPGSGS